MRKLSGSALGRAGILIVALTASPAVGTGSLRAQDTAAVSTAIGDGRAGSSGRASAATTQAAKPPVTPPKSVAQRVFDTPWVLFPIRLAIVIVLLAVSLLFLIGGCWGAVRMAHLLRHMQWKEPPRRIRRGEVGAGGASLGFEFEERLNAKRDEDDERDRQIAWLRQNVEHLAQVQIELMGTMAKSLKASKRR